jgi:UPF0716 protein FxsA
MILPILLLLFIAVPILELAVIIQVGQLIGLWPTLALLVADSIVGTMLMRSQGRQAWRRFNEAVAAGRPPAREALDGALIIFGGAFLLAPGFCTDILGLLFLLPPTRAIFRAFLIRRVGGSLAMRFAQGAASRGSARFRRPGPPPPPGPGRGYDVDGTATESDPRHLP